MKIRPAHGMVATLVTQLGGTGFAKLTGDKNRGREIYTLTDTQLGEWRKAAEPVVQEWKENARKAGIDPDVALAELKAAVVKYKAF